ncbi:peptidoglycan recognition protein family protein [Streptomonospora nanhaiensis]|uniref:peptidoglycan recognition protein family protein n=1 Tax=Streptomonospora nanhaiensis TaxID=1323731 RepID=UPI001C38AF30|nr:peptidoglycan recognition family protein [Streptomonospora nanhaiensis]MBV2364090.1 peptidoglycan recognition protein family protein [Streptomonospora nanhaiensis]
MSRETTGTLAAAGAGLPAGVRDLVYVRRAGWGADESLRFDASGAEVWPRDLHPVQAVTVHHTALGVAADPHESVRAVYRLHAVENGWGDIGYHLLIDPAGTVYEGRHTGGPVPVFAAAPLPGRASAVTAGHVGGRNPGNIGVCLLGDFTGAMPTEAALSSLVSVLRTLCALAGVDPRAGAAYVNPVTGDRATVPGTAMHRDWGGTACPGAAFAARFDEVRGRV